MSTSRVLYTTNETKPIAAPTLHLCTTPLFLLHECVASSALAESLFVLFEKRRCQPFVLGGRRQALERFAGDTVVVRTDGTFYTRRRIAEGAEQLGWGCAVVFPINNVGTVGCRTVMEIGILIRGGFEREPIEFAKLFSAKNGLQFSL